MDRFKAEVVASDLLARYWSRAPQFSSACCARAKTNLIWPSGNSSLAETGPLTSRRVHSGVRRQSTKRYMKEFTYGTIDGNVRSFHRQRDAVHSDDKQHNVVETLRHRQTMTSRSKSGISIDINKRSIGKHQWTSCSFLYFANFRFNPPRSIFYNLLCFVIYKTANMFHFLIMRLALISYDLRPSS